MVRQDYLPERFPGSNSILRQVAPKSEATRQLHLPVGVVLYRGDTFFAAIARSLPDPLYPEGSGSLRIAYGERERTRITDGAFLLNRGRLHDCRSLVDLEIRQMSDLTTGTLEIGKSIINQVIWFKLSYRDLTTGADREGRHDLTTLLKLFTAESGSF